MTQIQAGAISTTAPFENTTKALRAVKSLSTKINSVDASEAIGKLGNDVFGIETILSKLETALNALQAAAVEIPQLLCTQIQLTVNGYNTICTEFLSQLPSSMEQSTTERTFWSTWLVDASTREWIETWKGKLDSCKFGLETALSSTTFYTKVLEGHSKEEATETTLQEQEALYLQMIDRTNSEGAEIEPEISQQLASDVASPGAERREYTKELRMDLTIKDTLRKKLEAGLSRIRNERREARGRTNNIAATNHGSVFIGRSQMMSQDIRDVSATDGGSVVVGVADNVDIAALTGSRRNYD